MTEVVYADDAQADLDQLFADIADRAGQSIARSWLERIRTSCDGLAQFPERGSPRVHIRPGLRIIGFRRRATIAYLVVGDRVVILRVLARGRS